MRSQPPFIKTLINAHHNQRWKEVIKMAPKVSKKFQTNALAYILIGEAYAAMLDYGRARLFLEKAEKLSRDSPDLLRRLTQAWIKTRQFNAALPVCESALAAGCDDPEFQFWNAKLLIQTGAPKKELLSQINKVIERGYDTPESLTEWAKVSMRSDDAENTLDRVQDALASKFAQHQERWQLHHQSGMILDRLGRYGEAMEEVLKGKEIVAQRAAQFPKSAQMAQGVLGRLEKIRDSLCRDKIDQWIALTAEESQPEKVSFICGLPRTGTTLLESILGAHSETVLADETRLPAALLNQFLLRGTQSQPQSQFQRMESLKAKDARKFINNYWEQTGAFIGQDLTGRHLIDKSPDLSAQLPAVLSLLPRAQILIPTRDLRDNVLSIFFALPQGPAHWQAPLYDSLDSIADYYGIIAEILERVAEWYPERCLRVPYEVLVTDTDAQVRQCLDHLGLANEEGIVGRRSAESTLQSPTLEASEPVYRKAIGRWENYRQCFSHGRWEVS